jgi:hypothetical protein
VPRLGVYITSHNNPLFLRFCVLQVLAQTVQPHLLVIHENNHETSYLWAANDLLAQAHAQGMKVIAIHNQRINRVQDWHLIAIQKLIEEQCDYYFKFDHDDIYFRNHIERLTEVLDLGYDFVINKTAGRLILTPGQPYRYEPNIDFGKIHGPGGMSASLAFTRKFAMTNVIDLQEANSSKVWEDDITARQTMPKYEGKTVWITSDAPTTCYVSYGGNVSSAHWACLEWAKRNKHLFMND